MITKPQTLAQEIKHADLMVATATAAQDGRGVRMWTARRDALTARMWSGVGTN